MQKAFRNEHGQSIVIITIVLVGMIAMLGLVLDGGNAYIQRRQMQNAADAATLAGGRQLAIARGKGDYTYAQEVNIYNAINTYLSANGGDPSAVQAWFIDQTGKPTGDSPIGGNGWVPCNTQTTCATGISLTIATQFPTYFLGVVNINSGNVSAHAMVQTGAPSAMNHLFPTTVPTGTLTANTPLNGLQCQYNSSNDPPCVIWADQFGSGSSGWTNLATIDGPNINCPNQGVYSLDDLLNPAETGPTIHIGDWICTSTGSVAQLGNDLAQWAYIGKTVTIPIFDKTNNTGGQNLAYHVANFAAFTVVGYYFSSSSSTVSGGDTSCMKDAPSNSKKVVCGKFIQFGTLTGDTDASKKCAYGVCGFTMQQ